MFQKKDYIYSETMGVCRVEDVTNLSPKKGNAVSYYVLRSVYQKDKVAYIPAENHSVVLRQLISPEEAEKLWDEFYPEQDGQREAGDGVQQNIAVSPQESWIQEFADMELQYKMADTLPEEKRQQVYRLGEIEFVLKHRQNDRKENKKGKKQ